MSVVIPYGETKISRDDKLSNFTLKTPLNSLVLLYKYLPQIPQIKVPLLEHYRYTRIELCTYLTFIVKEHEKINSPFIQVI